MSDYPVVCFDESPDQLISHPHTPIPAAPGRLERVDDAYRREGTCTLFLHFESLLGWRHMAVTERRTIVEICTV